ncbi:hypothetical protein [Altericista sp. CCNU0014]|uniref:hypothetical protein n=1 Tax=Altericista sp. CCNU0014 TaxID=3082949 RepID=UPI00384F1736
MTRNKFDQFSKEFLEELLSPLGTVEKSLEVLGTSRLVDLYFAPALQTEAEPQTLGLLSRIAATPCLLEPFRNPPTTTEVKDCLLKLLSVHADLQRRTQRDDATVSEEDLPRLWILASSVSGNLLERFAATSNESWPSGIYGLGEALCTAIVAINQLPLTEDTLWLRLLGKGLTQEQAISEVLAIPEGDPRRRRILQLLAGWKITLEINDPADDEERGVLMVLSQAYLEWEKETEERGIQQGIQSERRITLENLFKARFGTIDESLMAILPKLVALSAEDYTRLLLELPGLSQDEVVKRFQNQP